MPADSDLLFRVRQVAEAARDNLGEAVDLVLVHNERAVKGKQPRAALNRAIILGSVSAWERFIADMALAYEWAPGADSMPFSAQYGQSSPGGAQLKRARDSTQGSYLRTPSNNLA